MYKEEQQFAKLVQNGARNGILLLLIMLNFCFSEIIELLGGTV
jgi:hypothetical protein